MSRSCVECLGLVTIVVLGTAGPSRAQSVDLDSLLAESTRLHHQMLVNRLESGSEELVRSSVGPFDVFTLQRRRDMVDEFVQERWSRVSSLLAGLELGRTALVVTLARDPSGLGSARLSETYEHVYSEHDTRMLGGSGARRAVNTVFRRMLRDLVASGPLEGFAFSEANDRSVTKSFFRVPLEAVTRCGEGEAEQCWRALGLVETEPLWHGWSTPEERRAAVARLDPDPMTDEERSRRLRCVRDGADGACDIVIAENAGRIIPSVRGTVRDHFLWHVLDNAEPGGLTRLVESEAGDVRTALEAAGKRPADDLVLDWVQSLGADPEVRAKEERRDRWAAVLWILILAIPAMRSRRWHSR